MIKLDCMALADCFTPEQLVTEIYRQCPDITYPVPVRKIAKAVGIEAINLMSTDDVEGMLVADNEKSVGVIHYKESNLLGRQNFTIGHELGHFLLLHHGANQSCRAEDIKLYSKSSTLKEIESEANQFSQLLLMPEHLIARAINNSVPNMKLLKSISEDFEMSFEPIANQCARLSNNPFALIYSLDGVVRYCWRDWNKFKYNIPFKRGDPMPLSSQAICLRQPEETISVMTKVDQADWFPNLMRKIPEDVIEQTYTQLRGYQVTMIRLE